MRIIKELRLKLKCNLATEGYGPWSGARMDIDWF